MNRRKFLDRTATLGAGLAGANMLLPLQTLFRWSLKSLVAEAKAESAGLNLRNYVQIVMEGAPPRWYFDHWLQTQAGDPTPSPFIVTHRNNTTYTYKTSSARGAGGEKIGLPYLWSTSIPNGDLTDL